MTTTTATISRRRRRRGHESRRGPRARRPQAALHPAGARARAAALPGRAPGVGRDRRLGRDSSPARRDAPRAPAPWPSAVPAGDRSARRPGCTRARDDAAAAPGGAPLDRARHAPPLLRDAPRLARRRRLGALAAARPRPLRGVGHARPVLDRARSLRRLRLLSLAQRGPRRRRASRGLRATPAHADRRGRAPRLPRAPVGAGRQRKDPLGHGRSRVERAGVGRSARRRWSAAAVVLALVLAAGLSVALWRAVDETQQGGAAEAIDVSLASRLAVSAAGWAIVRDHPLFGTGLGSWLHAFRPYQAPPVEGGIWDHAHNDYLELAAEGGLAAVALVLLFALALLRAAARRPALA